MARVPVRLNKPRPRGFSEAQNASAASVTSEAARVTACTTLLLRWCSDNGKTVTPDGAVFEDAAAEILDRSRGTLANWRTSGEGPPWYRSGGTGRVRYRLEDLARCLEAGRRNSPHD